MTKVLVINSLSYTGTTWLNTLLGCHERCFALGPADRVLNLCKEGKKADNVCRIHDNSCDFWPEFVGSYVTSENFFVQLAKASGKDIIITNNPIPDKAGIELQSPQVDVIQVNLIRDGRAILASYLRKFPDLATIDAITTFLHSSFQSFYFDRNNPDCLCLRYEDVLADKVGALNTIGDIVGLDYEQDALRFWKYEHHLTSGNAGFMSLIKFGQGLPVHDFKSRNFYEEQFKFNEVNNDTSFKDERWREELTKRDRFIFDVICGPDNERFGYERDKFSLTEISEFKAEFIDAIDGKTIQEEYVALIRSRLNLIDTTSPTVETVYIPSNESSPSLRKQLNWGYLRTKGIHLLPTHLKLLFNYSIAAVLVSIAAFLAVIVLIELNYIF